MHNKRTLGAPTRMYEAAFRNIDDTLWKDAGCSSELDYIEQAYAVVTIILFKKLMVAKQ